MRIWYMEKSTAYQACFAWRMSRTPFLVSIIWDYVRFCLFLQYMHRKKTFFSGKLNTWEGLATGMRWQTVERLTRNWFVHWKNVLEMDPSNSGEIRWLQHNCNFCIPKIHCMINYFWCCSVHQSWSRRWMPRTKPTLTTHWDYCASYETSMSTSEWKWCRALRCH